jgi:hypothetical protein
MNRTPLLPDEKIDEMSDEVSALLLKFQKNKETPPRAGKEPLGRP